MFYAKSTNGFYSLDIHGKSMPTDAIEISDDLYKQLFEGQASGKQIVGDEQGNPILIERPIIEIAAEPSPTKEELMAKLLEIQSQLQSM